MKTIAKTIRHPDGSRKVELFRRADGTYGFEELKWGSEELAWFPVGKYAESFTDSLKVAEKEARGRVEWLARGDRE